MKLSLESIAQAWPAGYQLPRFDVAAMRRRTKMSPTWLHIGAGNIFRGFLGRIAQNLLDDGRMETGIVAYEPFDAQIVGDVLLPNDCLTLSVEAGASGNVDRRVIASIAEALADDPQRLKKLMSQPSLQLVSFTITEKGYAVDGICAGPHVATTAMEQAAAGLLARFLAGQNPIALVTMDNFAHNGAVLRGAIKKIAQSWIDADTAPLPFMGFLDACAYPLTMIDKITPHPSVDVAKMLAADGFENTAIVKTAKNTTTAAFVNAETSGWLVIEDKFPAGVPPLADAGVLLCDAAQVERIDKMKVCACLNPLHTILAISGRLLGIPTINECMQDSTLVALIKQAAQELMAVVEDPGIIKPADFLHDVLHNRLPNRFIPDTPLRIACDTSQKVPVRFGVALQEYTRRGLDLGQLVAIPTFVALWLRYLQGTDDAGCPMEISPDPKLPDVFASGDTGKMLSHTPTFGIDLAQSSLHDKIIRAYEQMQAGAGAVRKFLATKI